MLPCAAPTHPPTRYPRNGSSSGLAPEINKKRVTVYIYVERTVQRLVLIDPRSPV